jgi:hypothetical protein
LVGLLKLVRFWPARSRRQWMGRACPLCPGDSDIHLFGNSERVIHLDAKIADCAFDLGVARAARLASSLCVCGLALPWSGVVSVCQKP